MKTTKELIETIHVVKGNFDHIAATGKISGTLHLEITRVMHEFLQSRTVNFDKKQLRMEFDEYMMSNMKMFTPDNVFEWLFMKLEELGAFAAYCE